jgi:hypothetical protein
MVKINNQTAGVIIHGQISESARTNRRITIAKKVRRRDRQKE